MKNIVEVVRRYMDLEEINRYQVTRWLFPNVDTYKACCPFHEERTPSFLVDAIGGIFMCFGCGKRGEAREFERLIHLLRPDLIPSPLQVSSEDCESSELGSSSIES